MSLAQVTVVATQVEKERRGYQAISLTNFALTTEPEISAGSVVEIGDALFEAAANVAITGWAGIAVSSDVYIRLVVTGAAADPEFTTTAPTWSLTKQGWYDATETKRYIGGLYKDAAGDYTLKWIYRTSSGGAQSFKENGDGSISFNFSLHLGVFSSVGFTISSETYFIPAGSYYYSITSNGNLSLQLEDSSGVWRTMDTGQTTRGAGLILGSDGTNYKCVNTGAWASTLWLIKISD